jgi:hypothetical protein
MELAATTTALQAPDTAKPHANVALDATVSVPDLGVTGLDSPVGTVTFKSGGTALCADVSVENGVAQCATSALAAGRDSLSASFTPAAGSTLHDSTSPTNAIVVGTTPAFTSPSRVRFVVGTPHTLRVTAVGAPTPRITLIKGRLPAGLRFHAGHAKATLSGTVTKSAVGTHYVTLEAHNIRGAAFQQLRITVARH